MSVNFLSLSRCSQLKSFFFDIVNFCFQYAYVRAICRWSGDHGCLWSFLRAHCRSAASKISVTWESILSSWLICKSVIAEEVSDTERYMSERRRSILWLSRCSETYFICMSTDLLLPDVKLRGGLVPRSEKEDQKGQHIYVECDSQMVRVCRVVRLKGCHRLNEDAICINEIDVSFRRLSSGVRSAAKERNKRVRPTTLNMEPFNSIWFNYWILIAIQKVWLASTIRMIAWFCFWRAIISLLSRFITSCRGQKSFGAFLEAKQRCS